MRTAGSEGGRNVSRVLRIALGLVGTVACAIPAPALAQGNIDAGKTPAQIFSDTCTACHRNARELKRTTEGFLRAHYVPSREEAAAMAGYLAAVANDPRAATAPQQKRAAPT